MQWADAIVSLGGDGTFLLAATMIQHPNKPLIGFNSDLTRLFHHNHHFVSVPMLAWVKHYEIEQKISKYVFMSFDFIHFS